MTETPLQSITNSRTWMTILAPTYSMKIFIIRTVMTTYVYSLCPSVSQLPEIRLSVSLYLVQSRYWQFSVIHDLMTNSLIIFLQAYDVYCQERPEIPLRYSEWQILISIYANSTNTFGDTYRASLWSPSYIVMFDSTQGIPPVSGSRMISCSKEYVFDIKKAVAINWTNICQANGWVLSITSFS